MVCPHFSSFSHQIYPALQLSLLQKPFLLASFSSQMIFPHPWISSILLSVVFSLFGFYAVLLVIWNLCLLKIDQGTTSSSWQVHEIFLNSSSSSFHSETCLHGKHLLILKTFHPSELRVLSKLATVTFFWLLSYGLSVVLGLIIRLGISFLTVLSPWILHLTVLFSFGTFLLNAFQALFPLKKNQVETPFVINCIKTCIQNKGQNIWKPNYRFSSFFSVFWAMFCSCFFRRSSFSFIFASFLFRISWISSSVLETTRIAQIIPG